MDQQDFTNEVEPADVYHSRKASEAFDKIGTNEGSKAEFVFHCEKLKMVSASQGEKTNQPSYWTTTKMVRNRRGGKTYYYQVACRKEGGKIKTKYLKRIK